jgi:hypothetical protein
MRLASLFACSAIALLGGCASVIETNQQDIEVRSVLDHREVGEVGCVLSNKNGRWFVTTPGRVTVRRSDDPLVFDCARTGVGSSVEAVASQYGTGKMFGNAVVSAGLGYYVDRRTGAGFDYPAVVTVLMRPDRSNGVAAVTETGSAIY